MRKSLLIALLLLTTLLPAGAQFYLTGDDPGHLRWYSIETPYYQVIFPQGTDSLARVYAQRLEQFRVPLGRSIGATPGEGLGRKMPVVLHSFYPYSNGSMGWAPIRMDLYPHPEPYGPDPVPWEIQLTSHEPRHQAQMQAQTKRGWQKFVSYLMGEAWTPVSWQLYLDFPFGEGDAVVAETAVASGTRARTNDFLHYYRVALDQGDFRSWERWRYGSFRKYAPNYYALGYVTLAGARHLYQDPLIMQKALAASARNPFLIAPYNFRKVLKKETGESFDQSFARILDSLNTHWKADAQARGPFMPMEQISPADAYYTVFKTPQYLDGKLYALRSGYTRPTELVSVENGKVRRIRAFASHHSDLYADPQKQRIYWSETQEDARWSLAGTSVISYLDLASGKFRDLTHGTRLYNPQPSQDGAYLAVAEYPVTGGTAVLVLDADTGQTLRSIQAPDGIQVVEFAWLGQNIYLFGISLEGSGLYRIGPEGDWSTVLAASAQKMSGLRQGDGYIEWTSDRTGVSELYRYYPEQEKLLQMTCTRYGVSQVCRDHDYLYYVSQTLDGAMLFRTPLEALEPREVDFSKLRDYPQEDQLRRQEQQLGDLPDLDAVVPMSAPKRFSKIANTRIHSWAPLYLNYDNVKSGSMDFSYETASLGLSGFFQSSLGTLSGMVGYSLHKDPDTETNWRNAVHGKLVYSGWYPVIEANLDLGDRAARQISILVQNGEDLSGRYMLRSTPSISGSLLAYIPLSFNKGGILYGVTPQLKYEITNDFYALSPIRFTIPEGAYGTFPLGQISDIGQPGSVLYQRIKGSVRGYVMLPRAKCQPYPSWGFGLEAGFSTRLGLNGRYTPNLYGYAYGYVPGFSRTQGLRLSVMYQQHLWQQETIFGDVTVNTAPRGFTTSAILNMGQVFANQTKFTADYAINFSLGDISIPWVAYIDHFTFTPHADLSLLQWKENLWSVGASLTASLGRILVFPFGSSLGVSFSYLGGSWYENTLQEKPYSVSLIFDMDLISSGRSARSRQR